MVEERHLSNVKNIYFAYKKRVIGEGEYLGVVNRLEEKEGLVRGEKGGKVIRQRGERWGRSGSKREGKDNNKEDNNKEDKEDKVS